MSISSVQVDVPLRRRAPAVPSEARVSGSAPCNSEISAESGAALGEGSGDVLGDTGLAENVRPLRRSLTRSVPGLGGGCWRSGDVCL